MELLWIITGALLPAALALGGALMADTSSIAHWGACLSFVVAGVWLAIVGGMWLRHKETWDWTVWLRAAGIAAFVCILTPFLIWVAWPASAQTSPSINGNCNSVGNNNSTCNTFNVAPQKFTFTEVVKADLLSTIPKDKRGVINVVGSDADVQVATEILYFLIENGYDVSRGMRSGMVTPAPDRPIALQMIPGGSPAWILTVAPSAK